MRKFQLTINLNTLQELQRHGKVESSYIFFFSKAILYYFLKSNFDNNFSLLIKPILIFLKNSSFH